MRWPPFASFSPAKKKIAVMITALAVMCAVGLALVFALRPLTVKSLTVEAGEPLPQATAFIIRGGKTGQFVSGLPKNTSVPGEYPLDIAIGKRNYRSTLIIKDTIVPAAQAVDLRIWVGAEPLPEDLVSGAHDATRITYSFPKAPDTSLPGEQAVSVLLTDAAGNTATVLSNLRIYGAIEKFTIDPGADLSLLDALAFMKNGTAGEAALFSLDTDFSAIDASIPGQHKVVLSMDGATCQSVLDVLDIKPPVAKPLQVRKFTGDPLNPTEFITDIDDETPVIASFAAEPDNMLAGQQDVLILLTDSYGNRAEISATLTLVPDTAAPVIAGMLDKTIFVGDTVAYRAGVTVTDNRDAEVLLQIDSGAVEPKTAGKYPVVYSATDKSGNTALTQGSVTVLDVARGQVDEMAGKILESILTDGMSAYEQANVIYKWVKSNVSYINTSVKDDLTLAAYRALKDRRGDCFMFAALSELLLTRAGIDNVLLQRTPGARSTTHYWSLVNTGEGWHHFDTTPHISGGTCFMLSESQVQELAKKRGKNYYAYDSSLYPEAVQ